MLSDAGSIMKRISSLTDTIGFMSPHSTCVGVGVEVDGGVEGFAWEHAHKPLTAAITIQTVVDFTFFFIRNLFYFTRLEANGRGGWNRSEIHMQPDRLHERRPAVAVVAGVGDELGAGRQEETTPDMRGVVTLENGLAAVAQPPVAEEKPESAERQILGVGRRQSIGREG